MHSHKPKAEIAIFDIVIAYFGEAIEYLQRLKHKGGKQSWEEYATQGGIIWIG